MPTESDIYELAFNGDIDSIKKILRENPQVAKQKDKDDNTPLHLACWGKQIGVIGLLLSYDPNINAIGCHGRTPLHYSVFEGRQISVPIVDLLLLNGADPDIKDKFGFPPDDLARMEMEEGLVQVLEMIEKARERKRKTPT